MALPPDINKNQSVPLLKALHILTRDGKLNQDSRRKLKQVNHLVNFIEPLIEGVFSKQEELTLVDHGAGKVIGIESRADLVKKSKALATECGFSRMQFEHLTVEASMTSPNIPETVDIVTALHACNTATDDAIQFGLKKRAQYMVLVPCCQAEVAEVMRQNKAASLSQTPLSEIWRHPIHTREFGSHITNVLRCLQLQSLGYQVTVTELVGWEHSMKNELIVAKFTGQKQATAKKRLLAILNELNLGTLENRFVGANV